MLHSQTNGDFSWQFRHPTVSDACAAVLAQSPQIHHLTVKRASVTLVVGWVGSQLEASVLIRWSRKPQTGPKMVWQTFSAVVGHSAASALG